MISTAPLCRVNQGRGAGGGSLQGIPPQRRDMLRTRNPPPQGYIHRPGQCQVKSPEGDREEGGKGGTRRVGRLDPTHWGLEEGKGRLTRAPCRSVPQPLVPMGHPQGERGDQGHPPHRTIRVTLLLWETLLGRRPAAVSLERDRICGRPGPPPPTGQ